MYLDEGFPCRISGGARIPPQMFDTVLLQTVIVAQSSTRCFSAETQFAIQEKALLKHIIFLLPLLPLDIKYREAF